jgi:hypothetical protein
MTISIDTSPIGTAPNPPLVQAVGTLLVPAGNADQGTQVTESIASGFARGSDSIGFTMGTTNVDYPAEQSWDSQAAMRFRELARKVAFEEASVEEKTEIRRLQSLRRKKLYPREADELVREYRQRLATNALKKALDQCVYAYSR